MYLHKTKNGHYTPPCCYFSGELEVVEILWTGRGWKTGDILKSLYSLIDTDEKFSAYVNEKARLSFYADFLYMAERC